jgi:hypothetical protein
MLLRVSVKGVLCNIRALMMEAAHTSEPSVENHFTRQYIPEDKSELHINDKPSVHEITQTQT